MGSGHAAWTVVASTKGNVAGGIAAGTSARSVMVPQIYVCDECDWEALYAVFLCPHPTTFQSNSQHFELQLLSFFQVMSLGFITYLWQQVGASSGQIVPIFRKNTMLIGTIPVFALKPADFSQCVGSPGGIRTPDQLINSQLLYH